MIPMGFFIGPQNGVHAGLITLSLLAKPVQHILIDAQGRVQRVFTDNNWKVDDFVAEMIKAAEKKS